jgi:thioredoxin 1
MCLPVYAAMEELESSGDYDHVAFVDMSFDTPDAVAIRRLPEARSFRGLPFTIYYKNGEVVKATASIQTKNELTSHIKQVF